MINLPVGDPRRSAPAPSRRSRCCALPAYGIAATAFEDEVAAASREMVSAIPARRSPPTSTARCVPVSWIVAPNADRLHITLCAALAAALTQITFQPQPASKRVTQISPGSGEALPRCCVARLCQPRPRERACDLELLSLRDHPSGGTHESRPTCTHDVAHP
jgi:hypothetical protein